MLTEPMPYEVIFTDGGDEVLAGSLDEACQMAECLLPAGQRLERVEGPDGCREFDEPAIQRSEAA